jgi:hypothetical protein
LIVWRRIFWKVSMGLLGRGWHLNALPSSSYGGGEEIFKLRDNFTIKFGHHVIVDVRHGEHLWNHQITLLIFGVIHAIELDIYLCVWQLVWYATYAQSPIVHAFMAQKGLSQDLEASKWTIIVSLGAPIMFK